MAVTLDADAPRAASSIWRSSIRWSCTGGTRGWMINTSLSRQFSLSWTWIHPLLNRLIVVGLSGTPKYEQMLRASSGCALPVKTTISRIGGEASPRRKYTEYRK